MQDILIVYDSKTGNTEKVAKALAEAAGERCVLAQVDAAPAADDFAVDVRAVLYIRTVFYNAQSQFGCAFIIVKVF